MKHLFAFLNLVVGLAFIALVVLYATVVVPVLITLAIVALVIFLFGAWVTDRIDVFRRWLRKRRSS